MKNPLFCFTLLFVLAPCLNATFAQIHISINILPAEPFVERPPRPTNNHVWVEGEWVERNNSYVRQEGHKWIWSKTRKGYTPDLRNR
jgi:hypothetical protein